MRKSIINLYFHIENLYEANEIILKLFYYSRSLICSDLAKKIIMCPLNTFSLEWHLGDICFLIKINRMFDNQYSILFSFLIKLWGILLSNL
jgi:hypothetical protein